MLCDAADVLHSMYLHPGYFQQVYFAAIPRYAHFATRSIRDVLLAGHEIDLLAFNILTYSIFDLWFDNPTIAALATFLLNAFVSKLRSLLGQQNIAKKALVDARFLI
jgi:hypothetical protein